MITTVSGTASRAYDGTALCAAEPSYSARQPHVPEKHVVQMWLDAAQPERVFRTTGSAELRVLFPGIENPHDGPDFLSAEIVFDGRLLRGDIEIHTHADDWWKHGHAGDAAYSRVILHVALYPPSRRDDLPPTVLLPWQLNVPLRDAWASVLPSRHPMPCSTKNLRAPHPDAGIMLLLMAMKRYHRKCERLRLRYEELAQLHTPAAALRQTAWESVARAAGYGGNQDRMERAARALTLTGILALHPSGRVARLSAAAGQKSLTHPGPGGWDEWRSSGVTPANRAAPRLRWLAGWAECLEREDWWSALEALSSIFNGDASVFLPLFRIENEPGSPGPERLAEIATNVLAPLLWLVSVHRYDDELARRARAVYFTLFPAAANRVTRIVSPVLGLPSRCSSLQQQGMLELFTELCSSSRCGSCLLSSGN